MSNVLTYYRSTAVCVSRRPGILPGPVPQYPSQLTPEQEVRLLHRSPCAPAPCAAVQRARLWLLAHQPPAWRNADLARQLGWTPATVRPGRRRWPTTEGWREAPRAGARRPCTALQRAQSTTLAWSAPRAHGQAWRRWAGETLAQGAVAPQDGARLSPGTVRAWLRQAKRPPWREHAWPPAPPGVDKAVPGLALSPHAPAGAAQGEAVVCRDATPSLQARPRVRATQAAAPGFPLHVAAREQRRGAGQRGGALLVAAGLTVARTRRGKTCAEGPAGLRAWCPSALGAGLHVVQLMLDQGSTHAPQLWGTWMASLALSLAVPLSWRPTHARWVDQVEGIFSKGQRDVRTPHDVPRTLALEKQRKPSVAALHRSPKPMPWTDTKTKLVAKFGTFPRI
jgi:hypothetical protein